jgi:hypothetical protein
MVGYRIEAHEATHAIVQGDESLLRRLVGRRRRRFVVQVDDHGTVSMRPTEPAPGEHSRHPWHT